MNNKDEEQQRKNEKEELERVINDFKILFYSSDYLTQLFLMITVPLLILAGFLFSIAYLIFYIPLSLLNIYNGFTKK